MTKEEWQEAEKALIMVGGRAAFEIDGYKIDAIKTQTSDNELSIVVFVNDKIKECWITEDCEVRRKFYFKSTRHLISTQKIKSAPKATRKALIEMNKEYSFYSAFFPSFKSFKRQLVNNNTDIKLIAAGV